MLRGHIDQLNRGGAAGWAQDDAHPTEPVNLIVTCNDNFVARIVANRYRADLKQAGIGNGRHSFQFVFPTELAPFESQSVAIRREQDGLHLPGSPVVLRPISEFGVEERAALARYLLAETDASCLDARITFLAEQIEVLLKRRAVDKSEQQKRGQPSYR
jgi:hypothetical protein